MATVLFQAVGSYIGGPIGGMIGAVIGGYVDQELFGPDDQEGPRLGDLRVTTSTYGQPIPLIYGPENRLAGNIIWSSDLIETSEESGGGKGGGPTFTEFSYRVSLAIAMSGRPSSKLKRIWANNKVIYDADAVLDFSPNHPLPAVDQVNGQIVTKYFLDELQSPAVDTFRGTHAIMDEVRYYPGSIVQIADTVIEGFEGVGNVPAYRLISYVVLKDLQLADFGNRIPNFEFELEADTTFSVGAAVLDMTERADITNASVVGLTELIRGFMLARQAPVYKAILPLAVAYNFETTEQRGQIRYILKSRGMKGTVPLIHMGGRNPSDSPSGNGPIEYRNITEVSMPDEVSLSYRDPAMDYQTNAQTSFRRVGNAINKENHELPIVLSADDVKQIADRLLWGAWSNKQGSQFSTSDAWARISPGDILGIPSFNETLPMKVVLTTRGNNGIIQFDTFYEDPEVFNSQALGIDGLLSDRTVIVPGDTTFVQIDGPLLNDVDAPAGFYWAATGVNDGWRGAEIRRSSDGGLTYSDMSDVATRNPVGTVTGTLGSGSDVTFDRATTLTVTLTSSRSTLESVSELLVLNGNNGAWVGPENGGVGEVIQFATATLISSNTYELTDLLRGRLGTEHAIDNHTSGEVFVLLQIGTLGSSEFGVNDWNKSRLYKPVSFLQDELLTQAQTFTNTGIRSKPLSPVHVKGTRDVSNNLTVTWIRRTRLRVPGLGNGEAPLGEATEQYEVDILSGATVVRTIQIIAETTTYTAAQQTTDGLTPGDPVDLEVFQISETRGRGYTAEATV